MKPYYDDGQAILYLGDTREVMRSLPAGSVHAVVTSPPYWGLRSYGVEGQLGMEQTPEEYVITMVEVFREVRRVLRDDGVCFINIGDSYAANRSYQVPDSKHTDVGNNSGAKVPPGLKPLDLVGIPWRLAFALQDDGWYLRSDIIWSKPAPMPESVQGWRWEQCKVKVSPGVIARMGDPGVTGHRAYMLGGGQTPTEERGVATWTDCPGCPKCEANGGLVLRKGAWRPTKSHEYIFLLTKNERYFCDQEAVRESFADERMGNPGSYRKTSASERKAGNDRQDLGFIKNGGGWNHEKAVSGRNPRSVWEIGPEPFPLAHFATFPEELPKRCLMAGTSSHGVCAQCGAPWARVVERGATDPLQIESRWARSKLASPIDRRKDNRSTTHTNSNPPAVLGWRATCGCGAELVSATALDPFIGSGTTAVAARALRLRCIGIDLNQGYLDMAVTRLPQLALL